MTPHIDHHRMTYLTRVIRHGPIRNAESYRTGGRRTPGPIAHGTLWAYSGRHCRCEVCTVAYLKYRSDLRHSERTWPAWAHGRTSTYKAGCRCKLCGESNARTIAEWRAKGRKEKPPSPVQKRDAKRKEYQRNRYQEVKAGTWNPGAK